MDEARSFSLQLPGEWAEDAECTRSDVDPNLFYPEMGQHSDKALEVCAKCLVRSECLEYAVRNGEEWGVWGGMSEKPRRRLIARTRRGDVRTSTTVRGNRQRHSAG